MGSSNKRNWARRALFALGTVLALRPAPVLADVCQYQNLMPEFFAFEAATKTLAPDIRAARFVKEFAVKHPHSTATRISAGLRRFKRMRWDCSTRTRRNPFRAFRR
jgi:type II secretory pathway component PulM